MATPAQPITGQDDVGQIKDFASRVRAKFPGAYDDMEDSQLAQRVVTKHPEYSDMLPKSIAPGAYQARKGGPTLNASQIQKPAPFESDVMQGMGFNPEKIAAAGPVGEQWRELGSQALTGAKKFGLSVAKDPFQIATPIESTASTIEQGVRERRPGLAVGGASMVAAGMEAPDAPQDLTQAARTTGNMVQSTGRSLAAIPENLGLKIPEAPKALRQAIQPGINIPRAGESIDIAGPRLQSVRKSGLVMDEAGNPLNEYKSPADLLQGIKAAKTHVFDAVEQRLGMVDQLSPDTSKVASAMEKSIPGRVERQFPQVADKIRQRAATYRGNLSLREIENSIQSANNDLRNFYKRPNATDSPISADMAATEAEVKTLRSLLDEKVEKLTGSGVADLKREYGALRDVEKAAARANAVATRQKGATLWEGLAALRAAGDFASGNMLSAAKGAGTLAMGRYLAKLRDPGYLIDQAFQGKKAFPEAQGIAPVTRRPLAGLLGPGPITGPPMGDTSGPSSMPLPLTAEGTRATRLGLLLPERTSINLPQGEPGGPSGPLPGEGLAARMVQRDPRTGKMKRVYRSY